MASLEATFAQATTHHRAGRLAEAEALYRAILEAFPQHGESLHHLGVIALQAGQPAAAVDLITRGMASGVTVDMMHHLGTAQRAMGDMEAARISFSRAVGMDARHAPSLSGLGEILSVQGFRPQAEQLFRDALQADPTHAEAGNNLGHLLKEGGRLDEAVRVLEPIAQAHPGYVEAINNLGVAYYERGRLGEAIAAFEACIRLAPNLPHVHNNIGNVFQALGAMDQAAAHYRETLKGFDASQVEVTARVLSNMLMCAQYTPGATALSLFQDHALWRDRIEAPLIARRPPPVVDRDPDRRLRLGFVAPHWGLHPVTYLTAGLMDHLDRTQFEVIWYLDIYRPEPGAGRDAVPADRALDTGGWSDDRLLEQMRADRIDIAFDLAGHSGQNRLLAFAQRMAPIQITWAGYAGTTGLTQMDYLLADRWQVPPGEEACYSEAILRLPQGYVVYDPPRTAPDVGPPPFRRNGFVTFGCFNNPGKINAPLVRLWAQVLREIPDSKLLLKYRWIDDPLSRARLDALFVAEGVPGDRLIFEGISPQVAMMARYNDVDVAFDTQPFGGGVTTLEALWMGVPVVAMRGATACGRVAACHLGAAGLTELLFDSPQEWVVGVCDLARDPDRMEEYRRSLRPRLAAGPLCDGAAFAAAAGDIFRRIWRRYVAGERPRHLDAAEIGPPAN